MFGLSSIPAFLQGVGMLSLPSSPRWLVSKQKHRQVIYTYQMLKSGAVA